MIRSKYSLNKIIYETNGQLSFFGRDNIYFKTINMSKKQRFNNICRDYNLKKLVRNNYFFLPCINIDMI